MRAWLTLAMVVAATAPAPGAGLAELDACDARVRSSPADPLSYYCYLEAVHAGAPADDAVRRLDAILAIDPQRHRARLSLGMIESRRRSDRAEPLLREAIDGMEAQQDHHGVVYGALDLSFLLGQAARLEEADRALERAVAAAEASGDPGLTAGVWTEQSLMARRRADYGRSRHLLRQAEAAVFPEGPAWLQANVLSGIGWLQWYFGDLRPAMESYRRETEIRKAMRDGNGEAITRFNLAFLAMALADRGEYPWKECEPLVEDALEATIAAGDPDGEGHVRLLRSRMLPAGEAAEECERAIALARRSGEASLKWSAMGALAALEIEIDPSSEDVALELVDAAVSEAREAGMRPEVVYALERRADLVTRMRSTDEAVAAWEDCLDEVEAVGSLQHEDAVRAYTLSHWSEPYHRLIDLLLEGLESSADPDADLERAFRTTERRHARSLLEILARRGVPAIADGARRLPTLAEVRESLGDDEVLLVYDVARGGARASWLLAIARDAVRIRKLAGGRALEDAVTVFAGMTRAGDALVSRAAADLYAVALDGVLDDRIERLRTIFVVPDGPLHRLPFAALRERPEADPIGTRMRLDVIPSASLWMAWPRSADSPGPGTVLSLADPETSTAARVSVFRDPTAATAASGGRLPHARDEARWVARALGGDGLVLEGSEASERALKEADLAAYRVLHLAAHAVVDDARPQRSAVLLAPGGDEEDGLLGPGEIAALDLGGQLVLLSACSGASGPVVGGEGVLGLARAFLQGGARAVVANLWPYRDDHAAAMTGRLARELGRGASAGEALTRARRARAAAGAPAGSWAGVILIGDGSVVPVPGGRGSIDLLAAGALAVLAAGLAWIALVRARRSA